MDVPLPIILVVVAAFWVAVIASWFKRQAVAAQATENQKCPNCGGTHLSADVSVVNARSGEKVGLVKNVLGGLLSFELGILLLWGGVVSIREFAERSEPQLEGMVVRIGSVVLGGSGGAAQLLADGGLMLVTWGGGLIATLFGVLLFYRYSSGRARIVELTCGQCGRTFSPL